MAAPTPLLLLLLLLRGCLAVVELHALFLGDGDVADLVAQDHVQDRRCALVRLTERIERPMALWTSGWVGNGRPTSWPTACAWGRVFQFGRPVPFSSKPTTSMSRMA